MKAKKQYSKPQLTQVRLVIQNPILANCSSVNSANWRDDPGCGSPGAPCADTAPPTPVS